MYQMPFYRAWLKCGFQQQQQALFPLGLTELGAWQPEITLPLRCFTVRSTSSKHEASSRPSTTAKTKTCVSSVYFNITLEMNRPRELKKEETV